MKKLNTFFYVFKKSLFKPTYYEEVLKAPFSFSLKYFIFLFFLLSLTNIISLFLLFSTSIYPYLNKIKNNLPDFFPADLVLQIKNGSLSINQPEPYFIPINKKLLPDNFSEEIKNRLIDNFVVIDTQAEPSEIRKYQTFLLLTKNHLAIRDEKQSITIHTFEDVKNLYLTQDIIKEIWQKITPYFKYITLFFLIFLLIFIPLLTISSRLFYLFFISIFSWIIAAFFKKKVGKISYLKALQINLHAISLPILITFLFQFLQNPPNFPFFQTIILLLFNAIIFASLGEK